MFFVIIKNFFYTVVRDPVSDSVLVKGENRQKFALSPLKNVSAQDSGGLSTAEPPGPIPNPEVKRCSADGSIAKGYARVGRCQVINYHPKQLGWFFYARAESPRIFGAALSLLAIGGTLDSDRRRGVRKATNAELCLLTSSGKVGNAFEYAKLIPSSFYQNEHRRFGAWISEPSQG